MKHLFLLAAVALLGGCAANTDLLLGSWVEPVPGMPNIVQGIQIDKGGQASSINMATLLYSAWQRDANGGLTLTGQSLGNGQTISFSEKMMIKKLTPDELVLQDSNGTETVYSKQK